MVMYWVNYFVKTRNAMPKLFRMTFRKFVACKDFAHYEVLEWVIKIKRSFHLIFVLQIYMSVESLKEE